MDELRPSQIISSKVDVKKLGSREQKLWNEMEELRRETSGIDIHDKHNQRHFKDIDITDIKKQNLFDRLKREERKMMSELLDQIESLEKTKDNIRNIKTSIHRIHSDIKKGFSDSVTTKMSFVYKKTKNSYYIKSRFWWDGGTDGKGGQREIQVGSIPSIIDTFNMKIDSGEEGYPKRKLSDDYKSISWDEFKEDDKLMKLLRMYCKPLIKSYLVTKLQSRRTLGYRIRTKDMTGVHRHYDGKTLSGDDINHKLDKEEIEGIIKTYGKTLNDTSWYKNIEKISKNR